MDSVRFANVRCFHRKVSAHSATAIRSAANAYANCHPAEPEFTLEESIKLPLAQWKDRIKNDFEPTVFAENPLLAEIKQKLYERGAIFAQMSGSGSTMYGIFEAKPQVDFAGCKTEFIELQ